MADLLVKNTRSFLLHPCISLSVGLSLRRSLCTCSLLHYVSVCLRFLFVCLSVYQSVCLFVSVGLFLCLFVALSLSISLVRMDACVRSRTEHPILLFRHILQASSQILSAATNHPSTLRALRPSIPLARASSSLPFPASAPHIDTLLFQPPASILLVSRIVTRA